jgi:hypothetical protein
VGINHTWRVSVGGVVGVPSSVTTSYMAPSVTSARVSGTVSLRTSGGEVVVLSGTNFGPVSSALRVVYRSAAPYNVEYVASSCAVTGSGHVSAQCSSVAGVGGGLQWRVEVGGQNGSWSSVTTTYAPATVTSASGTMPVVTGGGTDIVLVGTNFGP